MPAKQTKSPTPVEFLAFRDTWNNFRAESDKNKWFDYCWLNKSEREPVDQLMSEYDQSKISSAELISQILEFLASKLDFSTTTTLEFYGLPDTELPDTFTDMPITDLFIGCLDNLEQLPKWITKLEQLTTLNLYSLKQLSTLPDWIIQLNTLEKLSVSDTFRIAELPDSLSKMPNLKTIEMSRVFNLEHLPAGFSHSEMSDDQALTIITSSTPGDTVLTCG